ncbi:FKBP-type peptidyl-prolyl cis-trans isomerase N-terminal domain-containing protein [Serratia marcescens]|uniref:FKBP-type peptidyl-prolyl cis-trans isomerase N-terminal domain-containing protein n=1 Tax=Serratia marcescens TaxID=615 RepID=UPI0039898C2E
MIYAPTRSLARGYYLCLSSFLMLGSAHADNGIPALLQFAETYQEQRTSSTLPSTQGDKVQQANPHPVVPVRKKMSGNGVGNAWVLQQKLREREALIEEQKIRLQQQEQQLQLSTKAVSLQKIVSQLRSAITDSPNNRRTTELLAKYRQQAEQDQQTLAATQKQLQQLVTETTRQKKQLQQGNKEAEDSQQSQQQLQVKISTLQESLKEKTAEFQRVSQQLNAEKSLYQTQEKQLGALRDKVQEQQQQTDSLVENLRVKQEKEQIQYKEQYSTLMNSIQEKQKIIEQQKSELDTLKQQQKQQTTLQQQLDIAHQQQTTQTQKMSLMEKEIASLRAQSALSLASNALSTPENRQAYAAGTALGNDILALLNERQSWGMKTDRTVLQAGIIDAINEKYQLSDDELKKSLADSEVMAKKAHEKTSQTQQKKDEKFVEEFSKQKGAVKSTSGFWYRIDYLGDTQLPLEEKIDLVVKESLTDGTVIQDMDLGNKVISQSLDEYPPLFQEAIKLVNNHGEITLVIPPELAYGDTGYPPNIPPNATLVYNIRIEAASNDNNKK